MAMGIAGRAPEAASAQGTRTNADPAAQVMLPATPARPAQTPIPSLKYAGTLPTFAVTSVNKIAADTPQVSFVVGVRGADRFVAEDVTLRRVIAAVFNVRDFQLVGGPAWLGTDRFAITGKSERDVSRDQLFLMMRALLAERFHLRTHVESRAMAVHVLERVSLEAALGPGVVRQDCTGANPAVTYTMFFDARRGGIVPCGVNYMNADGIFAGGISMDGLASMLSSALQSTVVNRTGLEGTYSVRLDFGGLGDPQQDHALTLQANQASVFSAVRSQGLRLDRRSESVDVLVIDSVAQPSEN
jgi:uncharacterized protein (TIGR03435 family)